MKKPIVLYDSLLAGTPFRGLVVRSLFGPCANIGVPVEHCLADMESLYFEARAKAPPSSDAVRGTDGIRLLSPDVDTNIVFIEVDPLLGTAAEFVTMLQHEGVLTLAITPTRVRAVTHLDVDEAAMHRAAKIIPLVAEKLASGVKPGMDGVVAY